MSKGRLVLHKSKAQSALDIALRILSTASRILPAITPPNARSERLRLTELAARGRFEDPNWEPRVRRVPREVWSTLKAARRTARGLVAAELYCRRLDEIELDLGILAASQDPKKVQKLSAERFGTGDTQVVGFDGTRSSVSEVARLLLQTVEPDSEPCTLCADGAPDSLAETIRQMALFVGLSPVVRVEPQLASAAATGDRLVLVADRAFGCREVLRLAVHEVLGHLVAAGNGRAQPLRLFELGTGGSFVDQEGLSIFLEEEAGLLDGSRVRTLAARTLATDRVYGGASFRDVVAEAVRELHCSPQDAVILAERAFRGGGVARDVSYLVGWLRVRRAVAEGEVSVDELRNGRIGLNDVACMRNLMRDGWTRPPVYAPSLSRSLEATA
ncbi:MAG: tyrosine/phenylalanine carboxypeptidase domain-containing protein, partial [Myxococcota bacterium]